MDSDFEDVGEDRPRLWTMFDVREAQLEGAPIASVDSFPQGIDPREILEPAADGTATLKIIPAFSEGEPAAYVMPEVWAYFDRVWVQPWYFLVTAWDDKSPSQNRAKTSDGMNAPPVFDVGPESLFYSPLWVRYYAVLPAGADPALYTSAERIFDEKLEIHRNVPWTYSVRPDDVKLATPPSTHPFLPIPAGDILSESPTSWVDGQKMGFFDEGASNFKYDPATLVAEEVPLYVLARRGSDGAPAPLGAPRVMGSGPPFARRPADAPEGEPRFGAYSRLYFAVVPRDAGVFDPDAAPDAVAALAALGIDPQAYRGRVATDAACFAEAGFPAGCTWLDSQASIEDNLNAANIVRTDVTACTPLVIYGGKGIGR